MKYTKMAYTRVGSECYFDRVHIIQRLIALIWLKYAYSGCFLLLLEEIRISEASINEQ